MGLALSYEFRLPASSSIEGIEHLLEQLRERALAQQFEFVSPVMGVDLSEPAPTDHIEAPRFFVECVADKYENEEIVRVGDTDTARLFFVVIGDDCEPAHFGFMKRIDESEWYWWCGCKTQYASNHGDDHFLKCHLGLIALLDEAVKLGIEVVVYDEGEYWDTRDRSVLLKHLAHMNHLMAAFGGALADQLKVEAPIFEHPRFEHLEMGEDQHSS